MFPTEPEIQRFASFDGADLAWHELGAGRPLVLLHGFFSDARINWIKFGHAAAIATRGFRVIMPDLRAHGASARSHDAAAYPPDVLADDGLALIDHLGLSDYDLGGYSLGGRTTVRMIVRGARPGQVIVAGMGLSGLTDTAPRSAHFAHILDHPGRFEKFSPEWNAENFLKTTKGDPVALRRLIDSFVDTCIEEIAAITAPVLVLSGDEDSDNGSVDALAAALPNATLVRTPGGHMSAVTKAEFGAAIAAWLAR